MAAPSFKSLALPATIIAAAQLNMTMLRNGPSWPSSRALVASALASASPPLRSSRLDDSIPASAGETSNVVTAPSSSWAT